MTRPIAIVGVPTALGGHCPGWTRTPAWPRAARTASAGLLDAARAGRPRDPRTTATCAIDPGFRPDPDPQGEEPGRHRRVPAARSATSSRASRRRAGRPARLLILGGDCMRPRRAMAGLRAARPERAARDRLVRRPRRLQHARHDAVGQRLGDAVRDALRPRRRRSRRRRDGPTVDEEDAALFGGQVLDEPESRMLAASRVAHFGAGMLRTPAGLAALGAWAARSAAMSTACTSPSTTMSSMPRAAGRSRCRNRRPLAGDRGRDRAHLAAAIPVVGYGATAMNFAHGDGKDRRRRRAAGGGGVRP